MIRNLKELGPSLQKIVKRLCANQDLVRLLYYTDKDPYSGTALSETEIKSKIYDKLVRVVPYVGENETAQSIISIRIINGRTNSGNNEFRNIGVGIEVFTPFTQWKIKDSNLRPFAILSEIQQALNGKIIDGLGKISGGDFELKYLTDEISCYEIDFSFLNYD